MKTFFLILLCITIVSVLVFTVPSVAYAEKNYSLVSKWVTYGSDKQQLNPQTIAVDSSGNVYVGNSDGIIKLKNDGTFVTKWGSKGTGDGQFGAIIRIAVDSSGNVYVSDRANSRIQKFTTDGKFLTKFTVFQPKSEALETSGITLPDFPGYPDNIAVDSSGNVYVLQMMGIQKYTADGKFVSSFGKSDNQGVQPIYSPAIATDSAGNVYAVDNNSIKKFGSDGKIVTSWGSQGSNDGQFGLVIDVATDSSGNVYVLDAFNNRIQKFDSNGKFLSSWGATGSNDGQFNFLMGGDIAIDSAGIVYVSDFPSNGRIQIFKENTVQSSTKNTNPSVNENFVLVSSWGSQGTGDGQFGVPNSISFDSAGNVYITDNANKNIQKFTNQGKFIKKWGQSDSDLLGVPNGIAIDSSDEMYVISGSHNIVKSDKTGKFANLKGLDFKDARSITVDSSGNLYVVDGDDNSVTKATSDGKPIITWGSKGGEDGQFYTPTDIAVDSKGNVYVNDAGNNRVQEFDSNGKFITKWNSRVAGDSGLNQPKSIAVDSSGNIYVGDLTGTIIKEFSNDGTLIAKWDTGSSSWDLAIGPSGYIYQVDPLKYKVQVFAPSAGKDVRQIQKETKTDTKKDTKQDVKKEDARAENNHDTLNKTFAQTQMSIPSWIKNNAKWWSDSSISDDDFIKGIQYLMQNGIIVIPQTQSVGTNSSQQIPSWIKNNAGWWASGQISDDEFVKGIQYLVTNGIIHVSSFNYQQTLGKLETDYGLTPQGAFFLAKTKLELQTHNNTYYHFVEKFPDSTTQDITVTILPNQKYVPTPAELNASNSNDQQVYGVKFTHSNTTNTFSYELQYFISYNALPPDVVAELRSAHTTPAHLDESQARHNIIQTAYDSTHLVYVDEGTGNEGSGGNYVWVGVKSELIEAGKEISKASEEQYAREYAKEFGEGPSPTELVSAGFDIKEAWNLKNEFEKLSSRLDELEDCAKSSTNPDDSLLTESKLKTIQASRDVLKVATLNRYFYLELSVGSGLVPGLPFLVAPLTNLTDHWFEKEIEDEIQAAEDSVGSCEKTWTGEYTLESSGGFESSGTFTLYTTPNGAFGDANGHSSILYDEGECHMEGSTDYHGVMMAVIDNGSFTIMNISPEPMRMQVNSECEGHSEILEKPTLFNTGIFFQPPLELVDGASVDQKDNGGNHWKVSIHLKR